MSNRVQPQAVVYKGDIKYRGVEPSFLLTYIEKPIIINSFHGGRGGLESVVWVPLLRMNPLSLPWNQTNCRTDGKGLHSTRGYIFHG